MFQKLHSRLGDFWWYSLMLFAAWTVFLVCFMGCEFFRGILPDAAVDGMAALRLTHLPVFVWASFAYSALQFLALLVLLRLQRLK